MDIRVSATMIILSWNIRSLLKVWYIEIYETYARTYYVRKSSRGRCWWIRMALFAGTRRTKLGEIDLLPRNFQTF